MSEEAKPGNHHHHRHHHILHHHQERRPEEQAPPPPPPQYGTFEGVPAYPQPAIGFPQPVPPPGAIAPLGPPPSSLHPYTHGYQAVPGYPAAEGGHVREHRLPCCGLGCGWFLFIIGFILGSIPWYIGAILLICGKFDHREKPGYIACTIAAVLATIAIIVGAVNI